MVFVVLSNCRTRGSDTGGDQADSFVLAADEVTDDEAKATGIHVRNLGKVEDVDLGVLWGGSDSNILRNATGVSAAYMSRAVNGPEKLKDDRLGSRIVLALDSEGGALPDLSLHAGHSIYLVEITPSCDRRDDHMPG